MPVQTLLVDDQEVVRHGVRSLLENWGNLKICGEAENGEEALKQAARLSPDLIVPDTERYSVRLTPKRNRRQVGFVFDPTTFEGLNRIQTRRSRRAKWRGPESYFRARTWRGDSAEQSFNHPSILLVR
jgi:DNA-binding NarL/FixJ family response regulator